MSTVIKQGEFCSLYLVAPNEFFLVACIFFKFSAFLSSYVLLGNFYLFFELENKVWCDIGYVHMNVNVYVCVYFF